MFDQGNINVLTEIEKMLGLQEKILTHMPSLKPFLSKGIAQAAINAFSKLVANDGHKSSLHEEVEEELQKANRPKRFSMFKERRFALLGYTAAAQIHHFQDFMNTLTNTNSCNQLVQVCKLYLQVDYVTIALKCITWFTYEITLPCLNMCEL